MSEEEDRKAAEGLRDGPGKPGPGACMPVCSQCAESNKRLVERAARIAILEAEVAEWREVGERACRYLRSVLPGDGTDCDGFFVAEMELHLSLARLLGRA